MKLSLGLYTSSSWYATGFCLGRNYEVISGTQFVSANVSGAVQGVASWRRLDSLIGNFGYPLQCQQIGSILILRSMPPTSLFLLCNWCLFRRHSNNKNILLMQLVSAHFFAAVLSSG